MRTALACLALALVVNTTWAVDPAQQGNPLLAAINKAGRWFGIGYSQGYHTCPRCGCISNNCSCCSSNSCGDGYATTAYDSGVYASPGTLSAPTNSAPQPAPIHLEAPAAPTPEYMTPGRADIPDQYNEPEPEKEERSFVPKNAEPAKPQPKRQPPLPEVPDSEPEELPKATLHSDEPESPSDLPQPTRTQVAPPKSPDVRKPERSQNDLDDDLLVPPDTGLLDSVSVPQNTRIYRSYRTAARSLQTRVAGR